MAKKSKSQKEITGEIKDIKKEGDIAEKKSAELANLAESTKTLFESLNGEASIETAKSIESAATSFQQAIDVQVQQVEKEFQEVDSQLDEKHDELEESQSANTEDIQKLSQFQRELKSTGVSGDGITQGIEAKKTEVTFLTNESQDIEQSQKTFKQELEKSKQARQAAKFKYQSRNTLGS